MSILEIIGLSLFICAVFNLYLAVFLWLRSKEKMILHLGFVAFFSAIWAFFLGGAYFWWGKDFFGLPELFFWQGSWVGTLILPAFVVFTYYFIGELKNLKLKSVLLYSGAAIIGLLSLFTLSTQLFTKKVYLAGSFVEAEAGPLELLGRIYILFCLILGIKNMVGYYFKTTGFKKLQTGYFILGATMYAVSGVITVGLVPLFLKTQVYIIIPVYLSVVWVGLTTYAILARQLFEIKVILTDMLVGIIGIILLTLPLFSESLIFKIISWIVFGLFVIFGYLLIRYTHREAKQKEILEEKVKERTKELEKAKDVAEEKTKETEKKKEELERVLRAVVGRELRMVELKKRIKGLEEKMKEEKSSI